MIMIPDVNKKRWTIYKHTSLQSIEHLLVMNIFSKMWDQTKERLSSVHEHFAQILTSYWALSDIFST